MDELEPRPAPDGASPLRPDATVEEIQARVAHLSSTEAWKADAAQPTAEPAAATASEPPVDAGEPPPGAGMPPADQGMPPPEATKPSRRGLRALVGGGGAAVLIGLVILVLKFGVKLAVVGVAAAALAGTFGDRYGQLPSAQREAFERRYEAAIGNSFDGLSDREQRARLDDLVSNGAGRLDDGSLVLWSHLDEKAHAATDTATCAQIARGFFGKDADRAALSDAVSKAYDALPIDEFGQIIDLDLKAIEAERAGSPPVRSVSDATMDPILLAVEAQILQADSATYDALGAGEAVSDAAACSALRGLDTAAAKLSPAQYASWAVWISTP